VNSPQQRGSTAQTPDLDWSQIRETVLMLELASAQISAATRDSGQAVDTLTASFTSMVEHLREIARNAQVQPDTPENRESKARLMNASEEVSVLVHQAIVAFQFYDRLSQRLTHVEHSLAAMSNLIADRHRLFNPAEWHDLQNQIRSRYTTHEENAMFDAVMHGIPVHEAVERYRAEIKGKGDDIELF